MCLSMIKKQKRWSFHTHALCDLTGHGDQLLRSILSTWHCALGIVMKILQDGPMQDGPILVLCVLSLDHDISCAWIVLSIWSTAWWNSICWENCVLSLGCHVTVILVTSKANQLYKDTVTVLLLTLHFIVEFGFMLFVILPHSICRIFVHFRCVLLNLMHNKNACLCDVLSFLPLESHVQHAFWLRELLFVKDDRTWFTSITLQSITLTYMFIFRNISSKLGFLLSCSRLWKSNLPCEC